MYSSVLNHLLNLGHYLFSFALLFLLVPGLIFKREKEPFLDGFFSGYVRMVLFLILLGYVLVLLKLYELLTLVAIFGILAIWRYVADRSRNLESIGFNIMVWVYEWTDGLFGQKIKKKERSDRIGLCEKSTPVYLVNAGILVVIIVYAAYLRIYDTFVHAAPAMSDAYVTLAWMKYITNRILFHDGIYPQGFHIILATLQKFAAIDALYVLKYTGPFNGVLISLSIYYFISRLSGRSQPGMIGALIYGVMGGFMSHEWVRQASTNSQEFALIFVLPALYFFYQYIKEAKPFDLWTGAAAVCAAGLSHSLAFAFIGLGMGMLILVSLVVNPKEYWRRTGNLCLVGVSSVVISLLPVGIGLLLGKWFHGSSAAYLVETADAISVPLLGVSDYCAFFSLGLVFLWVVFNRTPFHEKLAEIFVLILGVGTYALYYWGGFLTGSIMISSRAGTLWALIVPVCLGLGWHILFKMFSEMKRNIAGIVLIVGLLCYILFILKPGPIIPYKMEHDSSVEQYLRINGNFRPTEWMIVSQEEGYALVYGKGYHLMMQDFLAWYDPAEKELTHWVNGVPEVLVTPDIFIYEEKRLFRTDLDMESLDIIYARREKEQTGLTEWLERYRDSHDNLSIFYEDDDLRIWRIHQPATKEADFRKLWEGET